MIPSGKLISAARLILGWTQADLARAARLHRCTIQYWEKHETITRKQQHQNSGPRRIEEALAQAGITFITEPGPGLCIQPIYPTSTRACAPARHGVNVGESN